ncbi:hypothetical protein ElyMa_001906100 [Elysia marginata]|uniref:Uncharacterized protein n=1 Tax=Elysia marginata TaxID=1093978 RepID=A0AAV4ESU5_9GAST|nr:hypothetical protein ElyMa_001906100 [Elysia marginata]
MVRLSVVYMPGNKLVALSGLARGRVSHQGVLVMIVNGLALAQRRTNDELDLDGHDGAIEIEAVPDEVPKEERQKHCVVRK